MLECSMFKELNGDAGFVITKMFLLAVEFKLDWVVQGVF